MMGMTPGPLVRAPFHFFLRFNDSVGRVSGLGSGVFVPTIVESKCGILCLSCFYQKESNTKVVDSLKYFGAQIPYSLSKFGTQFCTYSHDLNLTYSFLLMLIHQKRDTECSTGIHS